MYASSTPLPPLLPTASPLGNADYWINGAIRGLKFLFLASPSFIKASSSKTQWLVNQILRRFLLNLSPPRPQTLCFQVRVLTVNILQVHEGEIQMKFIFRTLNGTLGTVASSKANGSIRHSWYVLAGAAFRPGPIWLHTSNPYSF